MNINAIPEIRVDSAGDEVTYDLPRRNLGLLRFAGLVPMGFSALWCGGIGTIIVHLFHTLTSHPQPPAYLFCAFLFCFLIPGLYPAGLGLLILFGRCRVHWHDGHVSVSERVGPFGWPRRMPRQPIRKLVVMGGTPVPGGNPLPGLALLASLSATFDNGISRKIIVGYPRPWLEAIAQDLSPRVGLGQLTPPPPVEVYQGLTKELATDLAQKPAGSQVSVRRNYGSMVIEVPPLGFWKGGRTFSVFAVIWCLFIGAVTVAFILGGKFELKALPILLVFWLVGIGMMVALINLGKRRMTFTANPSQLCIIRSGPFGTRRFDFPRAEITNLSAGPSNVSENHRPVPELQIHLLTRKRQGFLMGRDPEELRWIATELRAGLGITEIAPAPVSVYTDWPYASNRPQKPAGPLAKLVGLAIFIIIIVLFFGPHFFPIFSPSPATRTTPPSAAPAATPGLRSPYPSNNPVPDDPLLAFNAFGPGQTYRPTTTWAVGLETHAEWFIPTLSGNLSEIQMAVNPLPGVRHPGKATIVLATDNNGYPGDTLEKFPATAAEASGLLTLASVKKPALQAGVKYWLCARSKGGWVWHFNDQNIVHNSARQVGKNTWASAGDFNYIGVFSIRVSTNQPMTQLMEPVMPDSESVSNTQGTNESGAP